MLQKKKYKLSFIFYIFKMLFFIQISFKFNYIIPVCMTALYR